VVRHGAGATASPIGEASAKAAFYCGEVVVFERVVVVPAPGSVSDLVRVSVLPEMPLL
jgi:hypothetical protein